MKEDLLTDTRALENKATREKATIKTPHTWHTSDATELWPSRLRSAGQGGHIPPDGEKVFKSHNFFISRPSQCWNSLNFSTSWPRLR